MAEIKDLDFKTRLIVKTYPFRKIDPLPICDTPKKPLKDCRIALVTTAGLVPPGEKDFEEVLGGDTSYRLIPNDVYVADLKEVHRSESFDHSGVEADRNIAFPLDRMKELLAQGVFKDLSPVHLSFMGSITAPGRLIKRSAPEAVQQLVKNKVDLALLIPI